MAEARAKERWTHTSVTLAVIANAHRDPKRRAFTPVDFNPYLRRQQSPAIQTSDLSILKHVFVDAARAAHSNTLPARREKGS